MDSFAFLTTPLRGAEASPVRLGSSPADPFAPSSESLTPLSLGRMRSLSGMSNLTSTSIWNDTVSASSLWGEEDSVDGRARAYTATVSGDKAYALENSSQRGARQRAATYSFPHSETPTAHAHHDPWAHHDSWLSPDNWNGQDSWLGPEGRANPSRGPFGNPSQAFPPTPTPLPANLITSFQNPSLSPTNLLVFVNLPPSSPSCNLSTLTHLFRKFGHLRSLKLAPENDFCLVEYQRVDQAMLAKASVSHQELMPGYPCVVAYARVNSRMGTAHSSGDFRPTARQGPLEGTTETFAHNDSDYRPLTYMASAVGFLEMGGFRARAHLDFSSRAHQDFNAHGELVAADQGRGVYYPEDGVGEGRGGAAAELHGGGVCAPTLPPLTPHALHELGNRALTDLTLSAASQTEPPTSHIFHLLNFVPTFPTNRTHSGPLPPITPRLYDAPRLRDLRKTLDARLLTPFELEDLALLILPELPELSSDYLGNTVVQKLFEQVTCPVIRTIMLREVVPYLSQMGIHKNGTWAAQKIILVATTPVQQNLIATSLVPYAVPLFNDQFGNYVLQCCLKFGAPYNDFIFVAILAHFWLISQGRFGARSVRACLESESASPSQVALVAGVIEMNAEYLATDANGALLLTWFLDTCTLSHRHAMLAPRLAPHLDVLCVHRTASLTVLKVVNNRADLAARDVILEALFGRPGCDTSPGVLLAVLADAAGHGAGFVCKVLAINSLDGAWRGHIVGTVRQVLESGVYPCCKRLMEEVGLDVKSRMNKASKAYAGKPAPLQAYFQPRYSEYYGGQGHPQGNPPGNHQGNPLGNSQSLQAFPPHPVHSGGYSETSSQGYAPQGFPPHGFAPNGYASHSFPPQGYAHQPCGSREYPPLLQPPQPHSRDSLGNEPIRTFRKDYTGQPPQTFNTHRMSQAYGVHPIPEVREASGAALPTEPAPGADLVLLQLEQLSLHSAALGYSLPGSPTLTKPASCSPLRNNV